MTPRENKNRLFTCTQCGDCCKGFGGTYLTNEDIRTIADFIGESTTAFTQRYCVPSGRRLVLAQGEDGFCIFYSQKCSIHPVKPRMCRKWPFIDCLLVDVDNWYAMADSCPGIQKNIEKKQLEMYLHGILNPVA